MNQHNPEPIVDVLAEYEKRMETKWHNETPIEYMLDKSEMKDTKKWLHAKLTARDQAHTQAKNQVYRERNLLVQALTKVFPAYLARHEDDESWEQDWRWIVYIEIPTRQKVVEGDQHSHTPEHQWFKTGTEQVSWHIHDSDRDLFNHLEVKDNNWDGHSTEEKYNRLSRIYPQDNTCL